MSTFVKVVQFGPSASELIEEAQKASKTADIDPNRYYSATFLADRWDMARDTIYGIPKNELPPTHLGPNGGKTKYLGKRIIEYEQNRTNNAP